MEIFKNAKMCGKIAQHLDNILGKFGCHMTIFSMYIEPFSYTYSFSCYGTLYRIRQPISLRIRFFIIISYYIIILLIPDVLQHRDSGAKVSD